MKPRVFVGSSTQSRTITDAIQLNLEKHEDLEVTIWGAAVFGMSRSTLNDLLAGLDVFDFAVFVCAADDKATVRGKKVLVPRDNVIFELGLFMGRLGPDRTFIVTPRGAEVALPTDLGGISVATYDRARGARDKEWTAALGPACTQIRQAIQATTSKSRRRHVIPKNDKASITRYLHDWIRGAGRVAIFSRDLSWAHDKAVKKTLKQKAAGRDLVICVPERVALIDELAGAEVYTYKNLAHTPAARFTIVDFGHGDARVAVGRAQGSEHVIEEFTAADGHPVFWMAKDLVDLVMKLPKAIEP